MGSAIRLGIIICDRYRACAAGKCLRALRQREGAFSAYAGREIELVGLTSCGGCPGGNVEYAPEEMKKNGAAVAVHLGRGRAARRAVHPRRQGRLWRAPRRGRNGARPLPSRGVRG